MVIARLRIRLSALLLLIALVALLIWLRSGQQDEVQLRRVSAVQLDPAFDVIVVGSEPEGIVAAVAAAQEGAHTLLVTTDPRLGGLFVMGAMNSLDLRTRPHLYQRGLFEQWWNRVGRGSSFDVARAEQAFTAMLAEAGVTVVQNGPIAPLIEGGVVRGVVVAGRAVAGRQVIDATADADLAAAAGAPYTLGFSSLGFEARMADTLVFRIDGVDWRALQRGIAARGGRSYAEINNRAAWGHFGGYPAAYQAVEPGIRLRGLNLGLQDDGSVLVNALLIYGIDPFDPDSRAEGYARAAREAPRIIEYLKAELPGFARARFGGVADALYIRQTRQLEARCTLTAEDVLFNRVSDEDVAAGGYPLDVQTLTPNDHGFVFGTPEIYGVRLCVAVPKGLDNLWVVGRAAGYDPIAASSARVVPFGMALGEAVGVAAVQAARQGLSSHALVDDPEQIQAVRQQLLRRGAYLPEVRPRDPVGPHQHPFFEAYMVLLGRGLALGGYENEPHLDAEVGALSYLYMLANVGQRFHSRPDLGATLLARFPNTSGPLTPDLALTLTVEAACLLGQCFDQSWAALVEAALVPPHFPPDGPLTRGEMYALAAAVARLAPAAAHGPAPLAPDLDQGADGSR